MTPCSDDNNDCGPSPDYSTPIANSTTESLARGNRFRLKLFSVHPPPPPHDSKRLFFATTRTTIAIIPFRLRFELTESRINWNLYSLESVYVEHRNWIRYELYELETIQRRKLYEWHNTILSGITLEGNRKIIDKEKTRLITNDYKERMFYGNVKKSE